MYVCKGKSACGIYTTHELCGGNVVKHSWEKSYECNKCSNGMWGCGRDCGRSYQVEGFKCTKCDKISVSIEEDKGGREKRIYLKDKEKERERIRLKKEEERYREDGERRLMMDEDTNRNTYIKLRNAYCWGKEHYDRVGNWNCKSNKYKNTSNNRFEEIWNNDKQYLIWMVNNNKFKNRDILGWIEMKKIKAQLTERFPNYSHGEDEDVCQFLISGKSFTPTDVY
tara:strand:+ start:5597 stop:6271 length:675 start_codon:yes stop_codon:yes gene_type:complete